MSKMLLPIHLSFVGIWLGCVVTEALFERALLGRGREQALILVDLHKRVDLFIEIPAFIAVLLTGYLMYPPIGASSLIQAKIVLGLIAITVNGYCVWLVFRRASAAQGGNWEAFTHLDHKQHQYGAVVLFALLAALVLGMYAYGRT